MSERKNSSGREAEKSRFTKIGECVHLRFVLFGPSFLPSGDPLYLELLHQADHPLPAHPYAVGLPKLGVDAGSGHR